MGTEPPGSPEFKYEPVGIGRNQRPRRNIRVFSILPTQDDKLSISMHYQKLGRRKSLVHAARFYSTNLLNVGVRTIGGPANLFDASDEGEEDDEPLPIEDAPLPFVAISYAWGDTNDTIPILCNGVEFKITRTLHGALSALRQKPYKGLIWADAICINQKDDEEKTKQVRMMGDIYDQAQHVFIWLGEQKEYDQMGLALIKVINDTFSRSGRRKAGKERMDFTEFSPEAWKGLLAILNRPWFGRAWVVQEYIRARERIFQCGSVVISDKDLSGVCKRISGSIDLCHLISMKSGGYAVGEDTDSMFGAMFKYDGLVAGKTSLIRLLARARTLQASRSQDRLFALVGLSSDTSTDIINYGRECDFEKLFQELMKDKMKKMYSSSDPHEIFRLLAMVSKDDFIQGRPSWAPFFVHSASYQSLSVLFSMKEGLITTVPEVDFTEPELLRIKGGAFDRVGTILDDDGIYREHPAGDHDPKLIPAQLRRVLKSVDMIWKHVSNMKKYRTGESLDEVFWRSLICNTSREHMRATSEMADCFQTTRECMALTIVLKEHEVFLQEPNTMKPNVRPADVLREIAELVPNLLPGQRLRWSPSPLALLDTSDGQPVFWSEMIGFIKQTRAAQERWARASAFFVWGRKYFLSEEGYVGWLPDHAEPNDLLCAFNGSRFPFVVRELKNGLKLIGACYMHGIMEGEAIRLADKPGVEAFIYLS